MARWVFTDGVASETYKFEISPNEGGTPPVQKSLTYSSTPGPDGSSIVFEGRDRPRVFSIGGVVHTEAGVTALDTWFDKEYQVKVTDDLGREFYIYITDLELSRAGTRRHPWRHRFRMGYIELDWQ